MRRIIVLFTLLVLSTFSIAQATVYRGAMDNRAGFTALPGFTAQGNSWYGSGGTSAGKGMRLEWMVDDETNPGYWTYTYTLIRGTAMNKAFALFDIETAADFTAANINAQLSSVVTASDGSGQTTMADPANSANTVPIASLVTLTGPVNFNVAHDFSNAAVTEADAASALNKTGLNQYSGDPGRVAAGVAGGTASATDSVGPVAHPFTGLRWTFPGTGFNSYNTCAWQVKLVTDRAPMWGSFFGWGDQTSNPPNWYSNLYSNNIDQTTRLATAPASTVDETGAMLSQFSNYQGWMLVPGAAATTGLVSSVSPANGATGVPAGANVTATFSTAMDSSTINSSNFFVKDASGATVSGTLGYNSTTRTATFSPAAAYTNGAVYTVTLTAGIKDSSANALTADLSWTFTITGTPDTTPPTIVSVTPLNGATDVSLATPISVRFSEAINQSSLNSMSVYVTAGSSKYTGQVSYDAATRTAVLVPAGLSMQNSTTYQVTLDPGVKDLTGNAMVNSFTWTYTTTSPTIVSTNPSSGATAISPNSYVSVKFGKDMDSTSFTTSTFTLKGFFGGSVGGTVSYDTPTRTAVFVPSSPLSGNTIYVATLTTGVKLLNGTAALTGNTSWNFTTAATDTTPPTVSSTNPASGALVSASDTTISAVFSENVDPATVSGSTFIVTNGSGASVSGTVSYNQLLMTAIFTPTSVLPDHDSYTAVISTGVKDVAGNAMAAAYTWSFTTPSNPPAVSSTYPANKLFLLALVGPVTATFNQTMDATTFDNAAFTVSDASGSNVPGTISYNAATRTASFTPTSQLANNAVYTATIAGTVKNLAGSAMTTQYTWTFNIASELYSGDVSNIYGDVDYGTLVGTTNSWGGEYDPSKPRGIRLSWVIGKVGDLWTYNYRFYGNTKATEKYVTNFDLSTPFGFTAADLLPGWTMYRADAGDITANVSAITEATALTENSIFSQNGVDKVTASKSLFGIQWHFNVNYSVKESPMDMFVLNFTSTRPPAWGDFIAYSGASGGGVVPGNPMAWNTQIGITTNAAAADGNNGGYALVPGAVASAKTIPIITWNTPAAIDFGTALDATQLNATASVPGTFVYTPAAGTVLDPGSQTLTVAFTPTDATNYTSADGTVTLTVLPIGNISGGSTPGIADALLALQSVVGLHIPTALEISRGDVSPLVNGKPAPDGKIDVGDALVILKRVVGLVTW